MKLRKFDGDDIVFWDRQQQPSFEAVMCVDSALLYAANKLDRQVAGLTVVKMDMMLGVIGRIRS